MRFASLLILTLGFVVGCGGKKSDTTPAPAVASEPATVPAEPATPTEPATAATPSDAELDAMFTQTLAFLSDMATAVGSNEKDCAKMAVALDAVMTKHKDLLAKAKSFEGNAEVDRKADEFMSAHEGEMLAAQQKLGTGLQACAADPGVQKAMARFDEQ
jgi:hypothetical protein